MAPRRKQGELFRDRNYGKWCGLRTLRDRARFTTHRPPRKLFLRWNDRFGGWEWRFPRIWGKGRFPENKNDFGHMPGLRKKYNQIGGWSIVLSDRVPTVSPERTVIGSVTHRPFWWIFQPKKANSPPILEIRSYRLKIIALYGKYIDFAFKFKNG